VLDTLTNWLNAHQLLVGVALGAFFSAFFSTYAQEVKQFLHSWPKTTEMRRQGRRNQATNRLELLKTLHNDSYHLLLYFGLKFFSLILWWLILAIVLGVIGIIKHLEPRSFILLIGGMMVGVFMGKWQEVSGVLWQLTSFDESVEKLERKASGVKPMKWAYIVTDNDSKEVKASPYEYESKELAMSAGASYVDKHKPPQEGGWSVTTSPKLL
jgi:hypothetical protein